MHDKGYRYWATAADRLSGLLGASIAFLLISGVLLGFSLTVARSNNVASVDAGALHDFGAVSQGSRLRHEFVVQNSGRAAIAIDRLVPSCSSCSRVRLVCGGAHCTVLEPGEAASLVVDWDVGEDCGEFRREFYLYWRSSEVGAPQRTVFAVTAQVVS